VNLYDGLTLQENLSFLARVRGAAIDDDAWLSILETTGLRDRRDDLLSTFSTGMKQRARFAGALLGNPSLYLLDEPTANLDESGRQMVNRLLEHCITSGAIVFLATNLKSEAERCGRVISVEDYLT
jgi:heme exporter protein A